MVGFALNALNAVTKTLLAVIKFYSPLMQWKKRTAKNRLSGERKFFTATSRVKTTFSVVPGCGDVRTRARQFRFCNISGECNENKIFTAKKHKSYKNSPHNAKRCGHLAINFFDRYSPLIFQNCFFQTSTRDGFSDGLVTCSEINQRNPWEKSFIRALHTKITPDHSQLRPKISDFKVFCLHF